MLGVVPGYPKLSAVNEPAGVVNFAFVKSDVFYLIPGDESWGLTMQDLQEEKFEYLRNIEGR